MFNVVNDMSARKYCQRNKKIKMNYEHPEYEYSAPINLEETRLGYFDVII